MNGVFLKVETSTSLKMCVEVRYCTISFYKIITASIFSVRILMEFVVKKKRNTGKYLSTREMWKTTEIRVGHQSIKIFSF